MSDNNTVDQVRDLVEEYLKPEVITLKDPRTGNEVLFAKTGNSVVVIPDNSFEGYRDEPTYRTGTAALLSLDSFIDHLNRFKDDGSAVFANDSREAPSLTAVIDYHPEGAMHDVMPRFGKHRSTFAFPLSDEWKAWAATNGPDNAMGMVDFAAFLENRIIDVQFIDPVTDKLSDDVQRLIDTLGGFGTVASPNKLMELARGLQINENAIVQETVNLASGEGVVRFQTEHTDAGGAPLKVPSLFLICIPVFRNGPAYRIVARLRYRKRGPGVIFWYELWRTDRTFDHAFTEAVERVKAETSLPVMLGKPEA